jgi:altronate hydrolase
MSDPVWQGYLRADSRLGVRNLVLVLYTVECASHVALEIGRGEAIAAHAVALLRATGSRQ